MQFCQVLQIWVILQKTVFGYELKACGYNSEAGRYAGMNEKKNVISSMAIAGALAGLAAVCFTLQVPETEFR